MDDSRKVAVVAGASSGIGRATAISLARAGYDLVLVARTRARLEETAEHAGDQGGDAEIMLLPLDLRDPGAAGQIVDHVQGRFGRLDALANVAGVAPNLPIGAVTPELWADCIDTNLGYIVRLTAAAWPVFQRAGAGVIVNVSSLASVDPFPGFAIYAAAKIGVNMFTRVTAREGAEIGLRAVSVAPGPVETEMLRGIFDEAFLPRERVLPPAAVADVIAGCITGARAFESGETILLPGP